jgi:hypothetical protein
MREPLPREILTSFNRLGWRRRAGVVGKLDFKAQGGGELKSVRATPHIPPFTELLSLLLYCRSKVSDDAF